MPQRIRPQDLYGNKVKHKKLIFIKIEQVSRCRDKLKISCFLNLKVIVLKITTYSYFKKQLILDENEDFVQKLFKFDRIIPFECKHTDYVVCTYVLRTQVLRKTLRRTFLRLVICETRS